MKPKSSLKKPHLKGNPGSGPIRTDHRTMRKRAYSGEHGRGTLQVLGVVGEVKEVIGKEKGFKKGGGKGEARDGVPKRSSQG